MREILRRHWIAVGERHGVITPDGRPAEFVIAELAERTPQVIVQVRRQLPSDFPSSVSEPILEGLQAAANKLLA